MTWRINESILCQVLIVRRWQLIDWFGENVNIGGCQGQKFRLFMKLCLFVKGETFGNNLSSFFILSYNFKERIDRKNTKNDIEYLK